MTFFAKKKLEFIKHIENSLFFDVSNSRVTARSAPAHERVIRTLRAWNVRVDEAFFLGGMEKKEFLKAFGANIFFDDQATHLNPASEAVPSAQVPYKTK